MILEIGWGIEGMEITKVFWVLCWETKEIYGDKYPFKLIIVMF